MGGENVAVCQHIRVWGMIWKNFGSADGVTHLAKEPYYEENDKCGVAATARDAKKKLDQLIAGICDKISDCHCKIDKKIKVKNASSPGSRLSAKLIDILLKFRTTRFTK